MTATTNFSISVKSSLSRAALSRRINSVFSPPVTRFNSQIPRTESDLLARVLGPPLDLDGQSCRDCI